MYFPSINASEKFSPNSYYVGMSKWNLRVEKKIWNMRSIQYNVNYACLH